MKKKPDHYELTLYPIDRDISKPWYVEVAYTDPVTNQFGRKQYRGGINYFKTVTDRTKEAKDLTAALKIKLSNGWNPLTGKTIRVPKVTAKTNFGGMPFNAALKYAFDTKAPDLSKKSKVDIGGVIEFIKTAATKIDIDTAPVIETKRAHVKLLMEQVAKDRQVSYAIEREKKYQKLLKKHRSEYLADKLAGPVKQWTGNSYNKYMRFLSSMFAVLLEFDAVEFNPCDKISKKAEIKTNKYRHATDKEEELIKETLLKKKPMLLVYLATEYLTGIRPKEIFGLQITDIDDINQCFFIQPTDEKSKTKSARMVPIPNTLLPYLEQLGIKNARPDDYLFSNDFMPGPVRKRRDYATKLWKELIIDGLGINVKMYSFKGKGGEAKRKAGIELEDIGAGWGHGRPSMSRRYLHGEADRINRVLIEKTPTF